MKWTTTAFSVLTLSVLGCGFLDEDVPDADQDPISGDAADAVDASSKPTSLGELSPVFSTVGPNGQAPDKVVLRFDRDLTAGNGAAPGADTQVSITPDVPGSWAWSSGNRLIFTPERGFAPGTTYEFGLTAVESPWGALEGSGFSHTIETPAFEVVSASRTLIHPDYFELDVVFSGAVNPEDAKLVTFRASGKSLPAAPRNSGRTNRYRFRIERKLLPEGIIDVDIRVGDGARSALDPSKKARSTRKTVSIDTTTKTMEIRNAKLQESADGWFLEFICHDDAVGDAEYWWDERTYDSWEVSERCEFSPDALTNITMTPSVSGLYVVEGRHGFRLFGDFEPGPLTVDIAEGAFTVDGGVMEEEWSEDFDVPTRTPRVELLSKSGRYLPKGSWGNLPIQHLNTDGIDIEIRHVPPQNLAFWLSGDDESTSRRTADVVAKTTIPTKNPPDQTASAWIDVASLVKDDLEGLFEIRVKPHVAEEEEETVELDTGWEARRERRRAAERKRGTGDTSRIVITDMQLVAKSNEIADGAAWADQITAWALDADTNQGRSGVDIDAIRASGFVMASCRTGFDGSCSLDMPEATADDAPPIALVARKGGDFTYLKFDDLETPLSESHVGGTSWTGEAPYAASLYGDRGVYRPGDTVHFAWVLRGEDHHAPDKQIPALLQIRDARGKVAKQVTLTTNDAGMAAWDLNLPAFAPTGRWTATLEIGGEDVADWPFSVEEFVPERMKVTAEMRGEGMLSTERGSVDVHARYLFGGSAEGSRVDVNCSVKPGRFTPEKNQQLHYGAVFVGTDTAPRETTASSHSETLNAEGEITVPCGGLSNGYPVTGTLVADVAVFEAGSGRSSRQMAQVPVHPETFYIGVDSGTSKAGQGTKIDFTGKIVDWSGQAGKLTDTLNVTLYRLEEEYGWWWWDDRGEESVDLYLRRVQEDSRSVSVGADGSFAFDYTPRSDAAGYLARVTSGNARTDFRIDGEARRYSWRGGSNKVDRTPRPAKPTSLQVQLPASIDVGQPATATFDVPFSGRVLMTVETHELLTHEWLDVEAGQAEWPFTVDTFVPNVYVSAFLVKDPHLDSPEGYAPERAFGVSSVRVKPDAYRYDVAIEAPSEVRSNAPLEVTVDVGNATDETWVTVAAVDEGILQLTRFDSPDPIADVFPRHRLGIRTFETVGWSVLMPAGTSSSHGGDGGGAGGRVQAVKPVALWSGLVKAEGGKATVTLDVPQYRGELRVMAVAGGSERIGSADAQVTVRDPLVLQTTLPRFLTQDDVFQVPVFVTNMSGKDRDITVSMATDNLPWPGMPDDPNAPSPVAFTGKKSAVIRVENGKSKTVAFEAKATALVGAATFRVKVESDGLVSYEELDVPFAPAGPKTREMKQVTLANGKLDLAPHLDGWLPTTEQSTLWVTPNPYGQAMGHLKHLVRYPYGCIEQTTSSTRPLLFVSSLVPAVMPELSGDAMEKKVMHGVDRVLSMQTASGGFAYWPGGSRPTPWGTVYATHMLIDAKNLQYDVPQDRIDDALDYLEAVVRQSEGSTSGFEKYRYSEPYAHYVLALAGRGKKARVNTLIGKIAANPKDQDAEALYLLQAALYKAGDRRFESQLRHPDASKLTRVRKNNWSFYSDLRRRGFALSVYHDLFGSDDDGAEDLARLVARGLEGSSANYSTQELVWGVTGLGKRVADGSKGTGIELKDGNKVLAPMNLPGGKQKEPMWAVPRASERNLSLNVGDTGGGTLYLVVQSEGVKENTPVRTGGAGLVVKREYLTSEEKPVDLAHVKLGDVVYTRITVSNTTRNRIQNLALVDRFAAGWEIENPRLGRGGVVDWIDASKTWASDHMNVRDDRLELFGALEAGESRTVVYGARAVTAGSFTAPPVEIEAMYDPGLWARQPGTSVTVEGPWADVLL